MLVKAATDTLEGMAAADNNKIRNMGPGWDMNILQYTGQDRMSPILQK